MYVATYSIMIALVLLAVISTCFAACPVWTTHNASSGRCECGNPLGGLVHCDPHTLNVSLLFCYCMTYNEHLNITAVGSCLYQCKRRNTPMCQSYNLLEHGKESEVNEDMCDFFNRTSQLCGRCKPGFGLPVYSYTLGCVNCTDTSLGHSILKYLTVAYLPLTVFYVLVILFKISVTSGSMVSYVLTCQLIATPSLLRAMIMEGKNQFVLFFFTVWNLDILRVFPPFCIHPKLSSLQVLALDYLVGFYPLLLILLTYFAVNLHDRYALVVKLWRPAYKLFSWMRREWDIRGSLVQAFATFFLLSYVKILNVSFDLLTPVTLKTVDGENLNQTYVFNDGEVVYLGPHHLPYFILAIVITSLFNILPALLLLLYPCKWFQRCLNCCSANSLALKSFMDAFQGCYRYKPRDHRYFAALYLFFRVLFLSTLVLLRDPMCFAVFGFYFLIATFVLILTEPYKQKVHNKTDTLFFLLYATVSFLGTVYTSVKPSEPQLPIGPAFVVIFTPLVLIPILYGLTMLVKNVIPQRAILLVKECIRSGFAKIRHNGNQLQDENQSLFACRLDPEISPLLPKIA